jgi:imidazolonepropionase-like amidohydrolase
MWIVNLAIWQPDREALTPGHLRLDGDRIAEVATGPAPDGVDATGLVVMPGLVNGHTHMMRAGTCRDTGRAGLDTARQILLNFEVELSHGVTTLVDLGAPLAGVVALRAHLDGRGLSDLRVAGPVFTAPGGYPLDYVDRDLAVGLDVVVEAGGVDQARDEVRRVAAAGVDVIKVAAMEVSFQGDRLATLDQPVFDAIVAAAHAHGLPVFAHAHTVLGYQQALAAGVDVIAHSAFEPLPDDLVTAVAQSGTVVMPTLYAYASFDYAATDPGIVALAASDLLRPFRGEVVEMGRLLRGSGARYPDEFVMPGLDKALVTDAMAVSRDNLRRLYGAGATLGFGTDAGFCFSQHGSVDEELLEMAAAGVPPNEVLRAATGSLARVLGDPMLGAIRAGAPADLVLLEGDPREDLGLLATPAAVIRAGEVVRCDPEAVAALCPRPISAARPTAGRGIALGLRLSRSMSR